VIEIAGRRIGRGCPTFVVAELSANHHGSLDEAIALVRAAKRAGADAVKLQTYTADTMTIDVDSDLFRLAGDSPWAGRTFFDLYEEAHTPWEWFQPLQQAADDEGVVLFSTPFDETAVDFLEKMRVPAYKISSFELVDSPLLERVARTGKPVVLSTGLASLQEIADAVATLRGHGCCDLVLLRCVSAYPASVTSMQLAILDTLSREFSVDVGLSDHSMEPAVAVAAVALGACIVEKHFILRRSAGGPDASFSLEPEELAALVRQIRLAEQAIGTSGTAPGPTAAELSSVPIRRSLFVVADMAPGDAFTPANVRAIRPGYGLAPKHLPAVLGRHAAARIARGTPLSWDLIAS
jgi:N-acetylneuraminate synthase